MPTPAHQTQTLHGARSLLLAVAAVLALAAALWPGLAVADQSSQPGSPSAGRLDAGGYQTCFVLAGGRLECWGNSSDGELGYGNTTDVGVNDTPAAAGPVDVGPGLTVSDVSVGTYHTCAILSDGSVRCWGYAGNGDLGYGNLNDLLSPASAGAVDIGTGYSAEAISAGGAETCVIRNDGSVLCWGFGGPGELGYGDPNNLGDTAVPGTHAPVDLGLDSAGNPATATAITAGGLHTCAILDDQSVRCWGYGPNGALGYGDGNNVGDGLGGDQVPSAEGRVNLGIDSEGQPYTAVAISAGSSYTCAILDSGQVLCWGAGNSGELGTGNTNSVGLTNVPAASTTVDLGPGRTATAIASGNDHTCAIRDDGSVVCWGDGIDGELGYGNTSNVGDTGPVSTAGAVNLGPGRTALAITAGAEHTCALLDNQTVRCWGYGAYGQLGYCGTSNVGDVQTPAAAGPVNLLSGDGGETCATAAPPAGTPPATTPPTTKPPDAPPGTPAASQAARARALRACLARAKAAARHGGGSASARAQRLSAAEQSCLRRYGRTPGKVTGIHAEAHGQTKIELLFSASGTDGHKPPPARGYLVKESLSPIRTQKQFTSAASLCRGACRFAVTQVGGPIALTITGLKPHTTYYYAVAALDNVSGRLGPRSRTVKARTA